MRQKFVGWLATIALATAGTAQSVVPTAKTQNENPPRGVAPREVLVELFTSEGCSSCPPADSLLRAIDGKHTSDGTLIVGVSEHVTYWNEGGWKDPFSADLFTKRQNDYGQRFHLDSVYTPQMVVNGETQFVGTDPKALLQAVQKAVAENGVKVSVVSVKMNGDAVEAVVSFAGELPKQGADVYAVVAQDETTEHVLRGENKGRTLAHASVARVLTKTGKVHEAGELTVHVTLPSGLAEPPEARRHLIVWAQEPNAGQVLGVDTKAF